MDEEPVALQVNGIAHAVMLATPLDLEDFALGFLLTEGLIEAATDLLDVTVEPGAQGTVLQLQVTARCEARFRERRRTLAGRTGCGLCGVESLDQLEPAVAPVPQGMRIDLIALTRAMAYLAARQPLQHLTGAVHAAAWCNVQGEPQIVREDVGRHNALDKLVGAMARAHANAATGFIVVTSRASYEMVQKTATLGIRMLVAVSAPTALGVQLARDCGVTLVGFARETQQVVYSHAARLV